jgi:hypothetical protein
MTNSRAAELACAVAWHTYLCIQKDVKQDDNRRVLLQGYVSHLCEAGEQDPDTLQTAGLVYLKRLDMGEEREARLTAHKALESITLRRARNEYRAAQFARRNRCPRFIRRCG